MDNTNKNPRRKHLFWWLIVLLIIVGAAYWFFFRGSNQGSSQSSHGRPATAVQLANAITGNVPVQVNALGTVTANQSVTVTSRIAGELMSVNFTEGQWVNKGQLLATVDTRTYQASQNQYQGELEQNRALLRNAELTLQRYRGLYAQNSLARQDLDSQIATVGQYRGLIASDEAQIHSAEVNIGYGRITAPISGYVGLRLTDVGNVVSADSTSIVAITQTHPIAVTFSVPQQYLAQIQPVIRSGHGLPVAVMSSDGSTEIAKGEVHYLSNSIDTATGSVELKALFPNKDDRLFPNQYVNVVLNIGELNDVAVVPEAAIQLSDAGNFVYVVNAQNVVHKQMITEGPNAGNNNVAVTKGLKAGDRVVTRGVDNLTDGAKVNPVQSDDSSDEHQSGASSNSGSNGGH
ncbi:Multidrug resistance protein MdtA [Halomonadaceae bacterium LMG 33818]|uniref:efflux RND transporter periplasmic adaptor subunit n=1 Tax=Cernens ardua TaxID=3402176 RepID=UPI003EDBF6A6